jgi:putative transposase
MANTQGDTALSFAGKEKITCIGLDMGIKHFLTQSDGTCIENPRYFEEDLLRLQLDLIRHTKGSADYIKNCQKIARLHERIMARRQAFLHKVSTRIVRCHDIIAVEKRALSEHLGQRRLSFQINDAAWRRFIIMLASKTQWYGKKLILIDHVQSLTKTSCKCRHKTQSMPLDILKGKCLQCETKHDRDINAAIDIMVEGAKIYLKNNPTCKQQLIPVLSDRR